MELSTLPPSYVKYWAQRYRLFSKYNEGIILDVEGWYSVTPELIAAHIAARIWNSILSSPIPSVPKKRRRKEHVAHLTSEKAPGMVLDAFCGPGGNAIQFALAAPPGGIVFAVDIDPNKIHMAKHNASIYGAQHRIEFIIGDSLRVTSRFRVDAIYLAPPWGGPNYIQSETYQLSSLPEGGEVIYRTFADISPNIAITLPKNSDQSQLIPLAAPGSTVEIEGQYLSQQLKMLTAYYGTLVKRSNSSNEVIEATSPSDVHELPWNVAAEDGDDDEYDGYNGD